MRRRLVECAGLLVGVLAVALMFSLISYHPDDPSLNTASPNAPENWLSLPGAYISDVLLQSAGGAAALPVITLLAWSWRVISHRGLPRFWLNLAALPVAMVLAALFMATIVPPDIWPLGEGLGGFIGALVLAQLQGLAAMFGTPVPLWAWSLFAGVLAIMALPLCLGLDRSEWRAIGGTLLRLVKAFGRGLAGAAGALQKRDESTETAKPKPAEPPPARPRRTPKIAPTREAAPERRRKRTAAPQPPLFESGRYQLPPLDLLHKPSRNDRVARLDAEGLEQNARLLESVLDDFGIKGEITNVRPGPVVTLYELEPAPGLKASRVISLADDIARSMSAISARVAVVPGRNVIGIELPNSKQETVFLRELLSTPEFERAKGQLPLAIGKDIGGAPVIGDLAAMPHLLIAGTTGSGKSVAINTMILSLLYRMTPEECRFIMIDPKMLELSVYDDIPHLLTPVVTDPRKAIVALKWAVKEMENRYRQMSKLSVRNITAYNRRLAQAAKQGKALRRPVQVGFDDNNQPIVEEHELDLKPLPLIVVVVDEMADLMLVAGKEVDIAVQRLSQMARAAGIHVIMATQRPSVDVITGTIKANFPTRISFQVSSKIDSRTILGEQGAEQMLGRGDMLFMLGGGRITRVHGPFVEDSEVEDVVAYLKTQGRPEYLDEVIEESEEGEQPLGFGAPASSNGDDLYDRAVAIIAAEGKASTSFLQRHLGIGYNRAAKLIEKLEKEGVVSPADHVGRREVLIGDHSA